MFCMLMRKYLSAARLLSVTQPELERIAELTFSTSNELGDIIEVSLIAEFLGNKTNIILVGADGRIIDSLRRSDPEKDERTVLPGAVYKYPDSQHKLNPVTEDINTILSAAENYGGDLEKALLAAIQGFSPLICRETVYKADKCGDFRSALNSVLYDIKRAVLPCFYLKRTARRLILPIPIYRSTAMNLKNAHIPTFRSCLTHFTPHARARNVCATPPPI